MKRYGNAPDASEQCADAVAWFCPTAKTLVATHTIFDSKLKRFSLPPAGGTSRPSGAASVLVNSALCEFGM